MTLLSRRALFALVILTAAPLPSFAGSTNVHTTWLWHLHQPVYWPDRRVSGGEHCEAAWDTIQQQNAGRPHPTPEVLNTIFGEADRVNVYQGEIGTVLGGLLSYPNVGAQVNYSGALMENVQRLAAAGQLGYGSGWSNSFRTARSWTTSGDKPRLDLVNFTYHHAIAPLVSDETLEMELRIARLLRANLFARLQTAFNGVHRIVIRLQNGLAPGHAAADGRDFRREHPVLVLKIIDLELVIGFHADNIDE